jgi:hypothetical protein
VLCDGTGTSGTKVVAAVVVADRVDRRTERFVVGKRRYEGRRQPSRTGVLWGVVDSNDLRRLKAGGVEVATKLNNVLGPAPEISSPVRLVPLKGDTFPSACHAKIEGRQRQQ